MFQWLLIALLVAVSSFALALSRFHEGTRMNKVSVLPHCLNTQGVSKRHVGSIVARAGAGKASVIVLRRLCLLRGLDRCTQHAALSRLASLD